MEKKVLNYRIVVEKENDDKGKTVYNAYCKTLGIADYGKTINQAISRITSLIKFHIESLALEGHKVPVEKEQTTVITSIKIPTPSHARFLYT
ncbi:MAG: hypothetical protein HYV37_00650 [Candidatus Levyibacteriota bacterium]|nr:MAG: hypothetical protein HYV37_00650 [Candidatus Levybacteria bacterium]